MFFPRLLLVVAELKEVSLPSPPPPPPYGENIKARRAVFFRALQWGYMFPAFASLSFNKPDVFSFLFLKAIGDPPNVILVSNKDLQEHVSCFF